jgi:predicted acetyltransferase
MRQVKTLAKVDFGRFVTVAADAYPGLRIVSAEDRERFRRRLLQIQEEDPAVDFYGLYHDGRLLGGMRIHDFSMTLRSVQAKAGGVGLVAVDLVRKKERVARDMVTFFLRHCQEEGATVALLYAFRTDFYKRMGFGYGTKMNQYRVRPASLPRGRSKEHVQVLGVEDKPALLACYNRYAERTHGMISRSPFELDRLFESPKVNVFGYKKGGEILGYVASRFQSGKEDNWLINDLVVREFVYETREALAELLTFLRSQLDQVRYIIFNLHDDGFHHLLLDPRNGTDNLIPSVYHESNTQGLGLMYRVVDTREVFRVLRNHNFGGQSCRLKLSIKDSFFPENDGSTVVHFEDGMPHLREGEDFEVAASLDVSDFSSLLMGVVDFRRLYRYGLADVSDPQYVATLDALFRTPDKPVCLTSF